DAHVLRHPITPDVVALLGPSFSPRPPSTRRWPARSRLANLPGRNGAPRPSLRSALANRGRRRDSSRRRRANQARPSRTAWARRSLPASLRSLLRSQSRRRARLLWGSAAATSASAVAPRRARRTAVGIPPSPLPREFAERPWAGFAQRRSYLAGPYLLRPG